MRIPITRSGRTIAILSTLALVLAACGGPGATTRSSAPSASTGGQASASTGVEPSASEGVEPSASEGVEPSASEGVEPSASEGVEPSASEGVEPSASEGGTVDLSGASFTVGSKEFAEQLILGQMTVQALESAGATVEPLVSLVGSTTVREALTAGDIDMYWEYTGTGWITHLGNTEPVAGSQEQYEAVRDADAENSIVWLEPAPFNNTYAIALSNENAAELQLTTLSDLATYVQSNAEAATLCAAAEFLVRDDGLPGLETAYGFDIPESAVVEVELGTIPPLIDAGEQCVFGEIFATDGRVAALGLTVLEDDLEFFPSYLPSLNVRQEVYDQSPALTDLFAPIAAALDTETMTSLNAQVEIEGASEIDVAAQFLSDNGFVSE